MHNKAIYLAIVLSLAASATSAAPWTYRGSLNDDGQPANGSYDLRVTLLNEHQSAAITSQITLYSVAVENGQFAVDVDFGIDLANAPAMRLQTEVRQGSSGFVELGEPTRFDPKASLAGVCWDTSGNAGTNPANEFLGTIDAQPFVLRTRNVQSLRIEPSAILFGGTPNTANIIAGSSANNVTVGVRGATIAGGGLPNGNSDPLFTSEGPNRATDAFGTIGGGYNNQAGDDAGDPTDQPYATVAGGRGNQATATGSTVSGGTSNVASGPSSVVSGGNGNGASGDRSNVGGGSSNVASGIASTVSGGAVNCAGGDYSWAGGLRAKIRVGNQPGDGNCAVSSGDANGDEGTFIWAGSQNSEFTSTGADQFLVRAPGGVGINTTSIPPLIEAVLQNRPSANGNVDLYMRTADHDRGINIAMLPTAADARFIISQSNGTTFTDRIILQSDGDFEVTARAFKPGGGSWSSTSDARLKKDVTPLSGALDRLLQLKPVEFTYITPDPAKRPAGRHIGFIAQEVAEVFPNWVEEDEDGFLTVGSQGFEALTVGSLREVRAENASLKASLSALEARLEALESER